MSNPVEALIATWRKEAAQWRHGIGDNARTQLLESHAAELASALASLRPSLEVETLILEAFKAGYAARADGNALCGWRFDVHELTSRSCDAAFKAWAPPLASLRGAAEQPPRLAALHAIERVVVEVFIDIEESGDRTFYARDLTRPGLLVDADTEVGAVGKVIETRPDYDEARRLAGRGGSGAAGMQALVCAGRWLSHLRRNLWGPVC